MFEKVGRITTTILACLVMWFSVALVDTITGSGWIRDVAVLAAFGATIALWLVLALPDHTAEARQAERQQVREKAKRDAAPSTGSDARLALLLELMTEEERHDLKARLVNDLGRDGEISLADLVAAQENDPGSMWTDKVMKSRGDS